MYSSKVPLVIEGTDEAGHMVSGSGSAPYRVFDPSSQEYLTTDIHERRDAEEALAMIGKALNRPVCRESDLSPKAEGTKAKLAFMRASMIRKHGACSTIPHGAIACAVDAHELDRIYGSLKVTNPDVEPMWILIKDGPHGRYTRYLMQARTFFSFKPGPFVETFYWASLPDHSTMINYLEERGLCPWQT